MRKESIVLGVQIEGGYINEKKFADIVNHLIWNIKNECELEAIPILPEDVKVELHFNPHDFPENKKDVKFTMTFDLEDQYAERLRRSTIS